MARNIIDGYRKIEGNYPTYREYLIHFYKKCGFREINSKAKYMIKE